MKLHLLFISAILLLNSQLPAQQNQFLYGVQTHFVEFAGHPESDTVQIAAMLDTIKSAGFQLIRDECLWHQVETVRGTYTFPKNTDYYIKSAQRRGIKVLLILNYNNPLYANRYTSGIITKDNRQAFVQYCIETVKRYSKWGVKYYEIWNEPNVPAFWDPVPDAGDYTELLKAVYPEIKKIDPSITVLGCSTNPAEGNPEPSVPWLPFIKKVLSSGGADYMDGLSFHPYRVDKNPDTFLLDEINRLYEVAGKKIPLWITEIGYPTTAVWPNVSQKDQAEFVSKLYLLGRTIDNLRAMIYYDFRNDGTNPAEPEQNFGLVNHDLTHKPAFAAFKALRREVGNKPLISKSITGNAVKLSFGKPSDQTYVFWSAKENESKPENFQKEGLRITSHLGKVSYIYNNDKKADIDYNTVPEYITETDSVPEISSLEINGSGDSVKVGQKADYKVIGYTKKHEKIEINSNSIKWDFSNSRGKIDSAGKLSAEKEGTGTITASFAKKKASRKITILPSKK